MQLASKPVASHEHIIFSLKEYKVSLREPWLLWATFLFRLSVPIIGKPQNQRKEQQGRIAELEEQLAREHEQATDADLLIAIQEADHKIADLERQAELHEQARIELEAARTQAEEGRDQVQRRFRDYVRMTNEKLGQLRDTKRIKYPVKQTWCKKYPRTIVQDRSSAAHAFPLRPWPASSSIPRCDRWW
jgi:hypothetical protein